jgi:hypothetical protein
MINIDDRIFPQVTESEFWLLCHIVKRLNAQNDCYPSNTTLLKDTRWAKEKLQAIKRSLEKKGVIEVQKRFNGSRQSSNYYRVKTKFMSVFVTAEKLTDNGVEQWEGAENRPPIKDGKSDRGEGAENPTTEVLTIEEVLFTDSNESVIQDASEYSGVNTEKKEKKVALKKKEKVRDVCYPDFVKAWTEAFPTLGFDAVSGSKIKSMIAHSRAIVKERTDAGVGNSELSEEQKTLGIFQYILDYVKRTNHWCQGKSITTFESKYREIYTEIIHGKPTPNKKQSARDYIDSLKQGAAHR